MKRSSLPGAVPRGAALAVLTALAAACTVAPPQPSALAEASFNGEAAVAAVRAAGGADARELDVQPIRDTQVEDLRQRADALEKPANTPKPRPRWIRRCRSTATIRRCCRNAPKPRCICTASTTPNATRSRPTTAARGSVRCAAGIGPPSPRPSRASSTASMRR